MFIPLIIGDEPVTRSDVASADSAKQREELVDRVASSSTFEKSPRLRAFFLHVCRCALENKPEQATEQQIGVHVYEKPADYNPNVDNVVRTAARLLRIKLEQYFANEGKDEPVVISIPKGRYVPLFEPRSEHQSAGFVTPVRDRARRLPWAVVTAGTAVLLIAVLLGFYWIGSRNSSGASLSNAARSGVLAQQDEPTNTEPLPTIAGTDELRLAAGRAAAFVDAQGRRWEADRYFQGGITRPGPPHLFPPVANPELFKTMREASSSDPMTPKWFRYDIPLHPGAYELRLYFADPLGEEHKDNEGAQNVRHFQVNLNGRPILAHFDAVADAGSSAVSIRAFKDVAPAADGKLHLEFSGGQPPFVNSVELTPGTPGKLKPIRIAAGQKKDFVDEQGTRWSADDYFIHGRTLLYSNPESGPKVPAVYTGERHGNFSYAIPVPAGSYTLRLHFLETFFSPVVPAAPCRGVGCRVFDVSCNGVALLKEFDIVQAAGEAFRPVVREFHGLRPNGQGKLLISFSPRVDYGLVRAIEVIDEAK